MKGIKAGEEAKMKPIKNKVLPRPIPAASRSLGLPRRGISARQRGKLCWIGASSARPKLICRHSSPPPRQDAGILAAPNKENFAINKTIKKKPFVSLLLKQNERLFGQIKKAILGQNYDLSLVFVGKKKIRSLNRVYRDKDCGTDILSFPLSKSEGEVFVNLDRAKIEAGKFNRTLENFTLFLFIHALCHLKGMAHGSRMEGEERKYRKIFKV